MYLEQGFMMAIHFEGRQNSRNFIQDALVNSLILGFSEKPLVSASDWENMKDVEDYVIFITIAAPGINRIHKTIEEYNGEVLA